jgi:Tfp pilus assembly protein PilF
MKGNLDGARRSFERALEHDPEYSPARMALEYLDAEFGKPL